MSLLIRANAPKFALFTKGSKLPLNKSFKNMFELLQSCAQLSICKLYELLCSGSIVLLRGNNKGGDQGITKTYLYNVDPLKPHFYIVKLGFTGVYIIFPISDQKHRLWVLVRTASLRRF